VLKEAVCSQLLGGPVVTYNTARTTLGLSQLEYSKLLAEKASATNAAETLAIFITDENGGPLVIPEP
jgi:hypothetical protein